jgi:FixJ family two-component response regulator
MPQAVQRGFAMTDRPPEWIAAVVDDDPRILESLESLLESAGHTVRPFASATALLESGTLVDVDFLISDIDLPQIDGFELMRLACALRPELPIILITGHSEMENRLPPIGHYRLFKKPFDGQELLTAVSDALRGTLRPTRQS